MHQGSSTLLRLRLSTAALIILILILIGLAYAEAVQDVPVTNVTIQPTAQDTKNFTYSTTPIVPITLPPRIFLTRTDTDYYTSTVYGSASPGTMNETITTIQWDWGDNSTPEYHEFPFSHVYSSPGTYTLSITAFQSDGQITTETESISIVRQILPEITIGIIATQVQVQPTGPGIPAGAPVLTLLEPVTDGMNVTLNGNLNPGAPGVIISSVTVDWDDGNITESPDLPITHNYSEVGIYTVNITGKQSDGQTTTKGITVDIKQNSPNPPPINGSNPPPSEQPLYLIILITSIIAAIIGVVAQQIIHRKRESSSVLSDIPSTIAVQEELYYRAKEKGDMPTAAARAHTCAEMFRTLAEQSPKNRIFYHEMAENWETKSQNAERISAKEHPSPKMATMPETLPSREELELICSGTDISPDVIDAVILVAVEIAREGREGQAVGTSFVIGDTDLVLNNSRQFVLNPFKGHKEEERQITDIGIRGNIKEFAQLDGAFIITGSGLVEAAGRYITADMSQVKLPEGLGSRHSSIAGITLVTKSIGVVVSQSGGLISIFKDGKIMYTINS